MQKTRLYIWCMLRLGREMFVPIHEAQIHVLPIGRPPSLSGVDQRRMLLAYYLSSLVTSETYI